MAKQQRWRIKQRLDTTQHLIKQAQRGLVVIGHLYDKNHPDYYKRFCDLIAALEIVHEGVEKLKNDI